MPISIDTVDGLPVLRDMSCVYEYKYLPSCKLLYQDGLISANPRKSRSHFTMFTAVFVNFFCLSLTLDLKSSVLVISQKVSRLEIIKLNENDSSYLPVFVFSSWILPLVLLVQSVYKTE